MELCWATPLVKMIWSTSIIGVEPEMVTAMDAREAGNIREDGKAREALL